MNRKLILGILVCSGLLMNAKFGISQNLLSNISIRAYAGWGYGRTNGNSYLMGEKDGQYNNAGFALVTSANPYEQLTINTSVEYKQGRISDFKVVKPAGGEESEEELAVEIDFVFAEWKFSDAFRFRVGQVKHPFGIYNEFRDVGTLRPLWNLAMGIYGPIGIASESYQGIGFTGRSIGESGWGIAYDIYGGSIGFEGMAVPIPVIEEEEGEVILHNVVGTRVIFYLPITGLSCGTSFYRGDIVENDGNQRSLGFHAEYVKGDISLQSEFAKLKSGSELDVQSYYVDAAYKLTEELQLAARYEASDTDLGDELGTIEQEYKTFLEHKEVVVGLNYWFNPNFVIKASFHKVDGNRFAIAGAEQTDTQPEETTNLIQFGAQFSF